MPPSPPTLLRRLTLLVLCIALSANRSSAQTNIFDTPLNATDLDPAAFAQWEGGGEAPVQLSGGRGVATPQAIAWTRQSGPAAGNIVFGESNHPGTRYLRIAWKTPAVVGSVVVAGGGTLSVLRPESAYPGKLDDDAQWIPAERIKDGQPSNAEVAPAHYAIWVLPPGTQTRALRFARTPSPNDTHYNGELDGVYVLPVRVANIADQAIASADSAAENAHLLNNGAYDDWRAWDNTRGEHTPADRAGPVSPAHPEWVMLTWPQPVTLRGLNLLWAGLSGVQAQAYSGPADRHPREAPDSDWRTVAQSGNIRNDYPRVLGTNWLDFGSDVTTRAVRLLITAPIPLREAGGNLNGKTDKGTRVWLGEMQALQPLGDAPLHAVIATAGATPPHAPIPIRFSLPAAGYVTLVLDDQNGRRVRNLVSETYFPAGDNIAWWDGTNDTERNEEAAAHGIYNIPATLVAPGSYRVRGLYHKALDLRYEFSIYSAGHPAWPTADHTGAWLANHTPPSCVQFVPGTTAPGGRPLIYIGSYVSEGTDGLAWVDLDGRKMGGKGWIGGNWTGAEFLARDEGANAAPGAYLYAATVWDAEKGSETNVLRLTALTNSGEQPVVRYEFPKTAKDHVGDMLGLAVRDGIAVCSLPRQKQLLFIDIKAGKVLGSAALDDACGLCFDAQGNLLVLVGRKLYRYAMPPMADVVTLPAPQVLITDGLEAPKQVTVDSAGNIYIADRGASQQVKVFTAEGKPLRAIGDAGPIAAGPYNPNHMQNPNGLTIDSNNHLWVAETDFLPKRISEWTRDGKLINAFYGPAQYGGGGWLDGKDKTRFYYADHGGAMEFALDWATGTDKLKSVFYRPKADAFTGDAEPAHGRFGGPETPLYFQGRQYMTNAFNTSPTNGATITGLWLMENGIAHPVAALGSANEWEIFLTTAYRERLPAGTDLTKRDAANDVLFAWSDANGDGLMEPEEVTFAKAATGAVTMMPDLSFVTSLTTVFAPQSFTAAGIPIYRADTGKTLVPGARMANTSGGGQVLLGGDGWTVMTVPPEPYPRQSSQSGARNGVPMWTYPSLWPGLHPSHAAPVPDRPGELIGTTRLLGGLVTPRGGDAGPLYAVNGNIGDVYLFTQDGLFVATLFQDGRRGHLWEMPIATRNMPLNDVTLHDENFWPSMTQTADGQVYLVDGGRSSLVRVDGLESVRRLPDSTIDVTPASLGQVQTYLAQAEALRQQTMGSDTLTVALRDAPPDWIDAQWATIDTRITKVGNWGSRPDVIKAALCVAGDRLYAAYRTEDPNLLANSGEAPLAPFKTGGALDLMLGTNPAANPKRSGPVPGDVRLLITMVKGKPLALLYRAVVPGTTQPVPFSSPWRTITLDKVENISDQVQLTGTGGSYEFSVPLATLGLAPKAGMTLRGDVGILRGNGTQTVQRVYWSNKATTITSDVPSEAMLTPNLWGRLDFEAK